MPMRTPQTRSAVNEGTTSNHLSIILIKKTGSVLQTPFFYVVGWLSDQLGLLARLSVKSFRFCNMLYDFGI